MAHVKQVPESEATGILARVYQAATSRVGQIANIIRVMSLDATSTQASMQFYGSVMKSKNALSAAQREMLATVVSNVNDCFY